MPDSHRYGENETRDYEHKLRMSTPQLNRLRFLVGMEIHAWENGTAASGMREPFDGEMDMLYDLKRQLDAIWHG